MFHPDGEVGKIVGNHSFEIGASVGDLGQNQSVLILELHQQTFRIRLPGEGIGGSLNKNSRTVEEHGGTIALESEEGKGMKMTVQLLLTGKGRSQG